MKFLRSYEDGLIPNMNVDAQNIQNNNLSLSKNQKLVLSSPCFYYRHVLVGARRFRTFKMHFIFPLLGKEEKNILTDFTKAEEYKDTPLM